MSRDAKYDIDNTASAAVMGTVVQVGQISGGVHHHPPNTAINLPHRFGAVPARAGCYQHRAANTTLRQCAESDDVTLSVLSGMGGVGKTQLAVDVAEHLWTTGAVDLLIWTTAGSPDAIVSDYARVAAALTGTPDRDVETGARRLLDWLANTRCRWLVILDDLHSPAHVTDWWPPQTPTGHVIVTTRRRDAALLGHGRQILHIDLFTPAESHAYLTSKLVDTSTGIDEVAADLGHLPLALSQAAAYMLDRNLTCADYRRRLGDQRTKLASLMPENDGLPDQYRDTIAATWSLSIERADQLSPQGLARPMMEVLSLPDPNGVPVALLTTPAIVGYLSRRVDVTVTADQAHDALGSLRRLNLVSYDPESGYRAVRVHALLQRSIRDRLTTPALLSILTAVALGNHDVWSDAIHDLDLWYIVRANAAAAFATTRSRLGLAAESSSSLGRYAWSKIAVTNLHQLQLAAAASLGPDHPDTLAAAHHLAQWQSFTGDSRTASTTLRDVLAARIRTLGSAHRDVLRTRHTLAECQGQAASPENALAALKDLLTDCERALGASDTQTLAVRYSLARWQGRSGDWNGASTALERLHTDYQNLLGGDHFETIGIKYGLARSHHQAGNRTSAAAWFQQLYADHLRVLGADHPDTRIANHSLRTWQDQDQTRINGVIALEDQIADRLRYNGPGNPAALDMRIFFTAYRARRVSALPNRLTEHTTIQDSHSEKT